MSVHEIAEEIGCSEGTVKSRLNYARKKIKIEVNNLEKREGTKLYSSGMGIIAIILRNLMNDEQIQKGFEKTILNNIKGKSRLGLKKSKLVNKKFIKPIIGIGIAVGLVTGAFIYNNVQNNKKQDDLLNNTNLNSEDIKSTTNTKKEIPCNYHSYYELGLSGKISEIKLDDNIALVKDYPEDKCIGLLLDDSSRDGTTTVHIRDSNNNEVLFEIEVDVECESVGPSYNYDEEVWEKYLGLDIFAYKLVTTGNITKVYGYDESVLKIENLEEERCVKIIPVGAGKTTATFVDDKGAEIKYTAEVEDYSEYVGHEDYSIENSKIDTPYKTVDIIWLADD